MPNIVMADQPSGGQEIVKLAYGTYTKTSAGTSMAIPVSYSGTLLYFFCHETEEIADTARSMSWQSATNVKRDTDYAMSMSQLSVVRAKKSDNTNNTPGYTGPTFTSTSVTLSQQSSAYPIKANDYYWEIWGYAT